MEELINGTSVESGPNRIRKSRPKTCSREGGDDIVTLGGKRVTGKQSTMVYCDVGLNDRFLFLCVLYLIPAYSELLL